jgi:Bacterial extracellular solute-binding proteins, family 5 Middle
MSEREAYFVLTEQDSPTSLDPLDSDNSNNLHASQMVHRSILEVGIDNTLTSSILSGFSYEREQRKIVFSVNDQARFSDGTPVRAEDVALSIKRMINARPAFPVLRHVKGVRSWVEREHPLQHALEGIQVDGAQITVSLDEDLTNPLFRFALPLFGVVKSSCVDLTNGSLRKGCPTSGYYDLETWDSGHLVFRLNERASLQKINLRRHIHLKYFKDPVSDQLVRTFREPAVIQSVESRRADADRLQTEAYRFTRQEQPLSRFTAFLLSPRNVFHNPACRRIFADRLRTALHERHDLADQENSLFSRLLPGYLSNESLAKNAPRIERTEEDDCMKQFKGQRVRYAEVTWIQGDAFFEALKATCLQLGLVPEPLPDAPRTKVFEAFVNGQQDVLLGGSGFWPFDPVGDLQMLFTPGLHKPLTFVTKDPKLRGWLGNLETEENPAGTMAAINQHIYDSSLLNVFSHIKRVYLTTPNGVSEKIPVAITPPAPWQMFAQ